MKYFITETHPLTLQGARNACKEFGDGWAFGHETSASLRCFKAPATVKSNCNDCSSFRILVWEDGADEYGPNSKHTVAGQYYGGHSPCSSYTNVPYCGVWGTGILFKHNKRMILIYIKNTLCGQIIKSIFSK